MSKTKQKPTKHADSTLDNELKQKITDLEQQLLRSQEQTLLARADLQNYRRRMEGERVKFGLMTNMQLVNQILEIIDDIQLALADTTTEESRAREMLQISQDKLLAALGLAGVEKVEITPGVKFDAQKMEAVSTSRVSDPAQDNTVIAVISSAFRYAGQENMLKTAKVIVGKQA